jgi:AraC-like DNA-binding protein
MDPLAEVLRSVRLAGGVFLDVHFTAPWCVYTQIEANDVRAFMTAPNQMIAYHFVIDGKLQISVAGEAPLDVGAGEIVLLPRNDIHTLASSLNHTPIAARQLIQRDENGGLPRISHGGGGEATHLVCGFLGGNELYNPLIATLPKMLKLDIREGTSRDWVEASMRYAAAELAEGKLASSGMMSRLSEMLFVEAVRNYASTLGDQETGWLNGLSDQRIGRAQALVHQNMGYPWSTEHLAKSAGMSRSAFVERFTKLIGMPPIRYLTVWRLQTAKLNLRETNMAISQLAHSVGYDSEEAFSRAFKREFGLSPARWKEQQEMKDAFGEMGSSDAVRIC